MEKYVDLDESYIRLRDIVIHLYCREIYNFADFAVRVYIRLEVDLLRYLQQSIRIIIVNTSHHSVREEAEECVNLHASRF